jgi:hypothetical protein
MACRISCGMIRRAVVLAVVLASGCRDEATAPSEPPKAAEAGKPAEPAEPSSPGKTREAEPSAGTQTTKEASVTTTPPSAEPEPAGPPMAAEAVVPHFQRWWKTWSGEHLVGNPLRDRLDKRVAAGGKVKSEACEVLADHVKARAPVGSPELLFGDPAALRGRTDRCWWLHHDGMMSTGLGAALASDGRVLVVWVVLEG